jgi:hypothetical protein
MKSCSVVPNAWQAHTPFLNPQLIGPVPDPMRPPILVDESSGDKLRLVAAELRAILNDPSLDERALASKSSRNSRLRFGFSAADIEL